MWHIAGRWLFAALCMGCVVKAQGQTQRPDAAMSEDAPSRTGDATATGAALPEEPGLQAADRHEGRSIGGTVTDANEALVGGALVVLSGNLPNDSSGPRTLQTSGDGFFSFTGVEQGTYKVTITSPGFSTWISEPIVLREGESFYIPHIVLRVATATTNVDVSLTMYDIAQEQVHLEEKQRVLGIFPNFYVSYIWDAVPLTSGQKFRLAFRNIIDPGSYVGTAFQSGIEQWQNDYKDYGQGAKGYFTRFAASAGDGFTSTMIAGAILPSILHQDPRYFYKGTGSKQSRALYAISTVMICKGDNGRWQPNYSNVFGNFAAAGISNAYYPPADRGVKLTIDNTLIGYAAGAVNSLFQEFLLKKISHGVQP
jgi:hypothetical protein